MPRFARVELEPGQSVFAGRLKGSPDPRLCHPHDWEYENSLSHRFTFVPERLMKETVRFVRSETDADVFVDLATGEEVFVGRTNKTGKDVFVGRTKKNYN
jgi:hypothetical protein